MRALGIAYVRFALQNPGHFRIMFRLERAEPGEVAVPPESAQHTMMLLTSTVQDVIREGGLQADVMELVLASWAEAHGLATLCVDGPLRRAQAFAGTEDLEDLAARVTAVSTAQLYGDRGSKKAAPKKSGGRRS